MDAISILQQALSDFCSQVLEDTSFVAKAFKQIHQMKREFGKGYALINIGEFRPDKGEFIYPQKDGLETLWLDETSTHQYLNSEIAANVLNVVDYSRCPDRHEVFIFMGSIDNGNTTKEGGYVPDPYHLKPSPITSKQIEKRLRRMANSAVRLLILNYQTLLRKLNTTSTFKYADDLVVLHKNLTVIQASLRILRDWLAGMHLELKPGKTRITHTLDTIEVM